jgi:hypothetical protein
MILKPEGDCVLLIPEDSFDRKLIRYFSEREGFRLNMIHVDDIFSPYAQMTLDMHLGSHRKSEPEYVNGVACS